MFSSLTLAPYWLVPILLTFIWWKLNRFKMWSNLPLMLLLMLSYSFFLKDADEYLYPPEPLTDVSPSCGMPYLVFGLIKFFFLFPASLLLQLLLNYIFLYKRNRTK
jgi:hypothetical protein